MSNVLVNDTSLTAIANAIRSKLGVSTTYKPGQMASAIQSIPTGGGGGNAYVSGSFTPSSRVGNVTIDVGSAMTVHGIAVFPHSESPLKSGGKTCVGLLLTPNAYYKAIGITSNNAGGSLLAPASLTSGSAFTQSGSSITLRPTGVTGFAAGQFETIQYDWIVW